MADSNTARKTVDQEFVEQQYNQPFVRNAYAHKKAANENLPRALNDHTRNARTHVDTPRYVKKEKYSRKGILKRKNEKKRSSTDAAIQAPFLALRMPRVTFASFWIWGICFFLFIGQVLFWMASTAIVDLDRFLDGWLPFAQTMWEGGQWGILLMGWLSILIALGIYIFSLVNPFRGSAFVWFLIAIIGYYIPPFNIIPWVYVWTISVFYNSSKL